MKNILIITNTSTGLYLFRRELIEKLGQNNTISVITSDTGNLDNLKGIGCLLYVVSMDKRGINPVHDMAYFRTLSKQIKKIRPDYVLTYTIKPNVYAGLLCRFFKIPYSVNITGLGTAFERGGVLLSFVVALYKTALKKASNAFFENEDNLNLFCKRNIIRRGQAVLLKGAGINLEKFGLQGYPKNDLFQFLFIGRIMAEKGVIELFDAAKKLNAEGYSFHLTVLGDCVENFKEQIERLKDQSWFTYVGFVKDVRPYIGACDCFVLPSWHEGMANTNLECAASGRPIITSNIPGCKEAVLQGISGLLCEPKNVDSLYCSMKTMLEMPREERRQMGLVGRKYMMEVFDKNKVVEQTINHLEVLTS